MLGGLPNICLRRLYRSLGCVRADRPAMARPENGVMLSEAVLPWCRVTSRLRELAGAEVAELGCTWPGAARWQQMSWSAAHP